MEWVFRILALQPGLEPGTCGLTVRINALAFVEVMLNAISLASST